MAITLSHFNTINNQPTIIEGTEEALTETISSCVMEALIKKMYPDSHQDIQFYIGAVYEKFTNKDDLSQAPDKKLIASSRDRFYFASVDREAAKDIRIEIFDEEFYAAQYGSNLFTDCAEVGIEEYKDLRVLVVDGETGESAGVLPPEIGRTLVGDGDGRISKAFASSAGFENSQFQTRGLIFSQKEAGFPDTCLLKGTLVPEENTYGYDLILSTDQLGKGRKSAETKVKLGSYTLDVDLGATSYAARENISQYSIEELERADFKPNLLKPSRAEKEFNLTYGHTSTGAQFWNCLPDSGRNFASMIVEDRLKELHSIQEDTRKIAWDYIQSEERRIKQKVDMVLQEKYKLLSLQDIPQEDKTAVFNEVASKNKVYTRIKTDLENHAQVFDVTDLNHLKKYMKEQYRDCATGRYIEFQYGMMMTNNKLADGEIRIANLPDGEEVAFYRSPVPNSNVIGVLKNNRLAGDSVHPGTIEMNRATYDSLNADTDGDRPAFVSKREICDRYAKQHSEWYGEYTGDKEGQHQFYLNKLAQYEEAFDGFIAEVKYLQQDGVRYEKIVTPSKSQYDQETFEEVALAGISNSIGFVANQSMHAIALEKEIDYLPDDVQDNYIKSFFKFHDREFSQNELDTEWGKLDYYRIRTTGINFSASPTSENAIRDQEVLSQALNQGLIRQDIYDFMAQYPEEAPPPLTQQEKVEVLNSVRKYFRDIVNTLAQQLEIEVQSEKSARRCDKDKVLECLSQLSWRPVLPLADRNKDTLYFKEGAEMGSDTHTVLDHFAQLTNATYKETDLKQRPVYQLKDLFQDVDVPSELYAIRFDAQKAKTEKVGLMAECSNRLGALATYQRTVKQDIAVAEADRTDFYLQLESPLGKKLIVAVSEKSYEKFDYRNMTELQNIMLIKDDKSRNLEFKVTACIQDKEGQLVTTKNERGEIKPVRKQIGTLTNTSLLENIELIKKKQSEIRRNGGDDKFISLEYPDKNRTLKWKATITPVATEANLDAIKATTNNYIKETLEQLGQRQYSTLSAAAAMWKIETQVQQGSDKGNKSNNKPSIYIDENENENEFDIENFDTSNSQGFNKDNRTIWKSTALFSPEVTQRLHSLQITSLEVTKINNSKINQHYLQNFDSTKKHRLEIRHEFLPENVEGNNNSINTAIYINDKRLGFISKGAGQLPIGTKAEAQVQIHDVATFEAVTKKETIIQIGNFKNYSDYTQDERLNLTSENQSLRLEYRAKVAERNNPKAKAVLVAVVEADNKVLGEIKNHKEVTENLSNLGVKPQGFNFEATLIAKAPSAALITIDPNTVEYPKVWIQRESQPILTHQDYIDTTIQPILSESRRHAYTNGEKTEYRDAVYITCDQQHTNNINSWLNRRGAVTDHISELSPLEQSLKAEVIAIDPRSLTETAKLELIANFGRVLDATPPEVTLEKLSNPELGVYYINPEQEFIEDGGNEKAAPAWGLTLSNADAEIAALWLNDKGIKPAVDSVDGISTLVVQEFYTRDSIRKELIANFGTPVDVSIEEGYTSYNEKITALQASINSLPQLDNQQQFTNEYLEKLCEIYINNQNKMLKQPEAGEKLQVIKTSLENIADSDSGAGVVPKKANPLLNLEAVGITQESHSLQIQMALLATQFIGQSALSAKTACDIKKYAAAWGELANTGEYSQEDTIMVEINEVRRGVSLKKVEQNFIDNYQPLLDKAIEAKSSFLISDGSNEGTKLVVDYLQEKGYDFVRINGIAIANHSENTKTTSFAQQQQAPEPSAQENIQIKPEALQLQEAPSPHKSTLEKIISGGQTGADLGALIAARDYGLPTGGTAPGGWLMEDLSNGGKSHINNKKLLESFGLEEGKKFDSIGKTYIARTQLNILESDGTLVLGNADPANNPGTYKTIQLAQGQDKPCLHINLKEALNEPKTAAIKISDFIKENQIQTINVAGNRESRSPGLQEATTKIITRALELELGQLITPKTQITEQQPKQPLTDLLKVESGIIVQQVNCQGKMGAGLALAIAEKYPQVKDQYLQKQDWKLGDVQLVEVKENPQLIVANVAGQDRYGTDRRYTDFKGLSDGLEKVAEFAQKKNLPVYIPEKLGSGLAGGATQAERQQTWKQVQAIIKATVPEAIIISPQLQQSKPQTQQFQKPQQTYESSSEPELLPKSAPKAVKKIIPNSTSTAKPQKPETATLTTIISGGQTGADMGALVGAKQAGFETGGTAPAGWVTEKGKNPKLADYGLTEGQAGNNIGHTYMIRTNANIQNSDATVVFGSIDPDFDKGSSNTAENAARMGKLLLHIPKQVYDNPELASQKLLKFIVDNNIEVLNVAGNTESKAPGIEKAVSTIVESTLQKYRSEVINKYTDQQIKVNNNSREIAPLINIATRSKSSLGAALTNPTVKSQELGNIKSDYPVSFRNNPFSPAGECKAEKWTQDKPKGTPFFSAEQAYQHFKEGVAYEDRGDLMAQIITAKFEQHPKLLEAVTKNGGAAWLEQCTHYVTENQDTFWEGKGHQSPFIAALVEGYEKALQITKNYTNQPTQNEQNQNIPLDNSTKPRVSSNREKWEQVMLTECFKRLEANPDNQNKELQSAKLNNSTIYFVQPTQTIQIVNASSEVLYQAKKGEAPTINNLNEQQKNFWLNQATKQEQRKNLLLK